MNKHSIRPAVLPLALALASAGAAAAEFGRLDVAAPGSMVSTCGGLNLNGSAFAIGDKGVWIPGKVTCNAELTTQPSAIISQSAAYNVALPDPIDTTASAQAGMGLIRVKAYSRATPNAGFVQSEATAGWADMLTVTPQDASFNGMTANFTFALQVDGTLAGQGANFSFNSLAGFGLKPYVNDGIVGPNAGEQFVASGQGQFNFPYNQAVNQQVTFTASIVLGTPFELGVFGRALAGNASSGQVFAFNEAMVDFYNTITWTGISGVTVGGNAVAYTVGSASGIDWTLPYAAAVPEPQTWALWSIGLLGLQAMALQRRRRSTDKASSVMA